MHIIHIASELASVAKVGGLADVLLGLSRELSWKGHDVDIIIPKYDCMDSNGIRDLAIEYPNLMSYYNGEWFSNTIWAGWVENLKVYFVDSHHPRHFFDRGCFYGCDDDLERYIYFCRAAIEFLYKKGIHPDIIHLHDWQSAVIAPLYEKMYKPLGYTKPKLVFTIHNIEYQGKCVPEDLNRIGLEGQEFLTHESMRDNQNKELINLLKGGIVYANFITTVSPNYAIEVLTPEQGKGLDSTLLLFQDKFKGIINGVDYSYWNPEIDRHLPAHYSSREMPTNRKDHNTIDKKAFIRNVLRERLMLAEEYRPVVGCVTRLVPQKGPELIKQAILHTVDRGGQFILLGSTQIPEINAMFHELQHRFSEHSHVHLILHHQEELAHLIYAASDMFIVPSIFEPCGLTQMIALKYGAIPIVRRTGGLADTIFDVDYSGKPFEDTNGYTFDAPDFQSLETTMDRAFNCWHHHPEKWRKLMINGMNIDFSWNRPSNEYVKVYEEISGIKNA